VIWINILIVTGLKSYSTIEKIIKPIKDHKITLEKASVSISAFISEELTENILKKNPLSEYDLVLLPGFVQWDTTKLEKKFSQSSGCNREV